MPDATKLPNCNATCPCCGKSSVVPLGKPDGEWLRCQDCNCRWAAAYRIARPALAPEHVEALRLLLTRQGGLFPGWSRLYAAIRAALAALAVEVDHA